MFINPLGERCLQIEKRILELKKNCDLPIQLQFVPLMNLKTISDYMVYNGLSEKDIDLRNQVTAMIYEAALDVKAAQMQGKKIARDFLLQLQKAVGQNKQSYNRQLALDLFATVGGDLEMFLEDRQSQLVKEAFVSDQQLAQEMAVRSHPSAIIFNCNSRHELGVRAEGCEELNQIVDSCQSAENIQAFFADLQESCNQHLHLL